MSTAASVVRSRELRFALGRVPKQPAVPPFAWTAALAVALLLAAFGCGSATAAGDDDTAGTGGASASGGTGATGGTSGTQGLGGSGGSGASGGSGGGMASPPATGFSITLTEPVVTDADAGVRTCNVGPSGSLSYAIGTPAPGGTVPDGTNGVAVNCSVALASDGTSMAVVASLGGPDATTSEALSFSVESPMIQSRDSAPAFITFKSEAAGSLSAVDDCMLGPFATLKTGAMLADFTCKLLVSPDDGA